MITFINYLLINFYHNCLGTDEVLISPIKQLAKRKPKNFLKKGRKGGYRAKSKSQKAEAKYNNYNKKERHIGDVRIFA